MFKDDITGKDVWTMDEFEQEAIKMLPEYISSDGFWDKVGKEWHDAVFSKFQAEGDTHYQGRLFTNDLVHKLRKVWENRDEHLINETD